MNLFIIRHGDALSTGDRPLSERGIRETAESARGLKALKETPTTILHSPLLRACQTAEIVSRELSPLHVNTFCVDLLAPGGERIMLLKEILRYVPDESAAIMLVGHLPSLGELVSYLVWGEPVKEIPLQKSSVACLEFRDRALRQGNAVLKWFLSTRQLSLIARNHGY